MDDKSKAKKMYLDGVKMTEIAKELGKSSSTVRSWKNRGKWDEDIGHATNKQEEKYATQHNATKSEKVKREDETLYMRKVDKSEARDVNLNEELTIEEIYGIDERERRFAEEYVRTGNKMQSALTAGYKPYYAKGRSHALTEKEGIKQYIQGMLASMSKESIMGAEEAMGILTGIARGEITETVVVGGAGGMEYMEKSADHKTRIAAIKEIMKRYPSEDKMTTAKLKKLEADTELSEQKVSTLKDKDGNQNENISITVID